MGDGEYHEARSDVFDHTEHESVTFLMVTVYRCAIDVISLCR